MYDSQSLSHRGVEGDAGSKLLILGNSKGTIGGGHGEASFVLSLTCSQPSRAYPRNGL